MRDYPIADALRAEVVKDYTPEGEYSGSQLVLKKADIVWVLERHNSGWWGGHKEGENLTGWFPKSLVRPLHGPDCGESTGSSLPGSEALYTSDHRAVATPNSEGARRRQSVQTNQKEKCAELAEMSKTLEAAKKELAAERRRAAGYVEAAAKAQAEASLLRQERERERQRWESERQHWDRRARESEAERQAQEHEVRRLHEEMVRSQVPGTAGAMSMTTASVPPMPGEPLSGANTPWWLQQEGSCNPSLSVRDDPTASRGSSSQGCQPRVSNSGLRSRGSSIGLSRRLFTHTSAPVDGTRTPPAGGPPPAPMPTATGSVSAPTMPTVAVSAVPTRPMATATNVSPQQPARPLSARHNTNGQQQHSTGQPPRPAPRVASTAPSWMGGGLGGAATVGVPSSPRHRPRPFLSGQPVSAGREDSSKVEVRALVSAFEQRSSSQGACAPHRTRVADPSPPGRQLLHRPTSSASRAGSREGPATMRGGAQGRGHSAGRTGYVDHAEPETPQHRPPAATGCEDLTNINFGMSPMQRQPHLHHVARQGLSATSCSPAKTPLSVQDRIRQLNSGRLGGR